MFFDCYSPSSRIIPTTIMARLLFIFALALATLAATTAVSESHLRVKQEEIDYDLCDIDSADCRKGLFSVSKGIKCTGGFSVKGVGKKCKGGIEAKFVANKKPKDVAGEMATVVSEQVQDFMPNKDNLFPVDEDMEAIMEMDTMLEGAEDGFSKTVQYGGFMKVEWGCEITYEKKGGRLSKKAECGFSGVGGMGPKTSEADEVF